MPLFRTVYCKISSKINNTLAVYLNTDSFYILCEDIVLSFVILYCDVIPTKFFGDLMTFLLDPGKSFRYVVDELVEFVRGLQHLEKEY